MAKTFSKWFWVFLSFVLYIPATIYMWCKGRKKKSYRQAACNLLNDVDLDKFSVRVTIYNDDVEFNLFYDRCTGSYKVAEEFVNKK